tara:strand:+ start:165 stop:710 length:546 start_codon:yes stop_codon:yes gene_type:complete
MLDNLTVMILITFFVFIISLLAFSLIRLIRGLSHSDTRLSSMRNHIYNSRNKRKNDFYNRLFFERNPFSWRIAFALAYANFNYEEVKRFNDSLEKVLSKEKEIIKRMDDNGPHNLGRRIKPFWKKNKTVSIQRYFDQFKSHILIEESSDKETLGYLLESEVANFSIAIREIQRNREMEPPF